MSKQTNKREVPHSQRERLPCTTAVAMRTVVTHAHAPVVNAKPDWSTTRTPATQKKRLPAQKGNVFAQPLDDTFPTLTPLFLVGTTCALRAVDTTGFDKGKRPAQGGACANPAYNLSGRSNLSIRASSHSSTYTLVLLTQRKYDHSRKFNAKTASVKRYGTYSHNMSPAPP